MSTDVNATGKIAAISSDLGEVGGLKERTRVVDALTREHASVKTPEAAVKQPASAERNVQFSLDAETGRSIVRIVDPKSGEVIRQIPSEAALEVARAVGKLQGSYVSEKA